MIINSISLQRQCFKLLNTEHLKNFNKIYNSKLLLFGEFVTIKGAQALAIPLNLYSGQWAYSAQKIPFPLDGMLEYMSNLEQQQNLIGRYDLDSFKNNIQSTLTD